ncbi:MAG: arylsulfatase, partial [Planctomycetota bacterium]
MIRNLPPCALLAATMLCATARAQDVEAVQEAAEARLPNIVLILADDLGIGDLGCYNPASKIPTPHMDRLASGGMRFTDAHSPSGVCTPTRYGVLTGRYCWRSRLKSGVLWGLSRNLIDPQRLTLPDLLRERGYRTGGVGKWHLGLGEEEPADYSRPFTLSPLSHGFDTYFGIPASLDMEPYVYLLDDWVVQAPSSTVALSHHRRRNGGGFWRAGPAAPDFRHVEVLPRLAARAAEFVERSHRDQPDRPFFLYFPLSAPHTPWLPTEEHRGRSGAGYYGDFVCQVDDAVGQVMAALERQGIVDQTLVIVTSDNGSHWPDADIEKFGHDANLGYRGQKADIWEGGHRVPFLVRWPGVTPPGAVRDDLLCLTDILATCAELTGATLPDDAGEDSLSQLAVFKGRKLPRSPREQVVHHSINGTFAVRRGRWKLIFGLGSGGFTDPQRRLPGPGEAPGQ